MILKKIKNEVGATAIEYAILSALIGVATITAMQLTGVKLDNTYCYIATQISKAVGGSGGRCSATSSNSSTGDNGSPDGSGNGSGSGTGDNGNAEPSTGSVNSSNSIEDGAKITDVIAGLHDPLLPAYIPTSYNEGDIHGEGFASNMTFGALYGNYGMNGNYGEAIPNLAKALSDINAKDPITNVFGTYHRTRLPLTDYDTVMDRLQGGGGMLVTGNNPGIEVTTAGGKVYNLYPERDGSVTKIETKPS